MIGFFSKVAWFARKYTFSKVRSFSSSLIRKQRLLYIEKIYKARIWKKNREETEKSVDENWRLLASMSVDNTTSHFIFRKWRNLKESIVISKNYWSNLSENLHAGPQKFFWKMNSEQSGGPSRSPSTKNATQIIQSSS